MLKEVKGKKPSMGTEITFNILGHQFRHNRKTAEQTMKHHQKVVCAAFVIHMIMLPLH
jgi:hypothetical protein